MKKRVITLSIVRKGVEYYMAICYGHKVRSMVAIDGTRELYDVFYKSVVSPKCTLEIWPIAKRGQIGYMSMMASAGFDDVIFLINSDGKIEGNIFAAIRIFEKARAKN